MVTINIFYTKSYFSSDTRSLPEFLSSNYSSEDIFNFFATQHFIKRRKGIFRRKAVSIRDLIHWNKNPLEGPLVVFDKSCHNDALKAFRTIQILMGDRAGKGITNNSTFGVLGDHEFDELKYLLELGLKKTSFRDELYAQLCKQINHNPSIASTRIGWEIMCAFVVTFPPSKYLENYLTAIVHHNKTHEDETIRKQASYCSKKLLKIIKFGNKGSVPSRREIERSIEAPFTSSNYGNNLEQIMEFDLEFDPCLKVPRIFTFLSRTILKLHGQQTEGIFRVPGDSENIAFNKVQLDRGIFDDSQFKEAHVPASLLKLWLRELEEPLIPAEYYERCVSEASNAEKCLDILDSLPDVNRAVAYELLAFLRNFSLPENLEKTKMTVDNLAMVFAPSFLRCPSDNPTIIFGNTKFEQAFVKTIMVSCSKK